MFHQDGNRRRTWKGRAFSLFLAAVLLLGSVPGFVPPASAHWADPYLDQLVDWGVMRADQTAKPDTPLTRAEFMAIINRAYGYKEIGEMPFEDVSEGDWFYDDVAIAYNAGYMKGTSKTTASPNANLTREQAVCILGRNMMMKETPGEDTSFTDSRSISSWARGMVKTAVNQYIIGGFPDDTFRPKDNITKGQMAVLVTRCVGSPVSQSGNCELGDVFGNVTITAPNVTLRNTTVSGDLYISGGVGLGGIKLENVNVLGRIVVSGTGESEAGGASVVMRNVTANEMLVDNMRDKTVTLRADGITEIPKTIVRTSAYIEDNNTDDKGLMSIELDGDSGSRLTLAGRIKEVIDKTPNSLIQAAKGTVAKLTVDEAATNSTVQINRNTRVKELNLDVAATVTGEGDVDKLNINAPGSVVSMLPDDIYIRPGIDGSVNGEVMDSGAAEESSLDPRLLSGYPAARDIAPTGFRADFSGNKKGTVYWAVSAITDGSVGEDDLISPPSYGSKALRSGSVGLSAGDTVGSTQVNGLSVGGSYYLSAVLVDSRDQRSPVKVMSFSTPDNTVPAFGEGYPYMSFIGKADKKDEKITAQVAVMATKSCRMYYAVLPQGAQTPTAADMKAGAVTGSLGYGVEELEKNTVWDGDQAIIVSRKLDEKKDYVLYLWLTDGVNSSAVTNLAFSTPDVTPPVVSMPVQTASTGTSVTLSSSMNEPGTIFWAVVAMDTNYPLPNLESNPLDKDNILDEYGNAITSKLESECAKLCVESGRGALVKGSAAVSAAGADVTINVTGRLEPETTYRLFYVGKDAVRNYSAEVKVIEIKTADTSGPIVKQYFRNATSDDKTAAPLANDDVVLDFSEPITVDGSKELLSLYELAQYTGTDEELTKKAEKAQEELREKLQKNFILHEPDLRNTNQLIKDLTDSENKAAEKASLDSWIDYSEVVIRKPDNKPGHIEVVFPNGKAISMKNDTTYYFRLKNVSDVSNEKNPMTAADNKTTTVDYLNMGVKHSLDRFSTSFASVILGDYMQGSSGLKEADYPVWQGYVPAKPAVGDKPATPAENQPGSRLDSKARVDAAFFVKPSSTSGAKDKYFDIAFFTTKRINYDLYYRIIDTKTGKHINIWDKEDTEYKNNAGNILPGEITKKDEETKGWVWLGEGKSSAMANEEKMYSSSLFNGIQSGKNDFPALPTLKEGFEYQFVISVTKIDRNDSWGSWNEQEPPIGIDIYVMAGDVRNLSSAMPTNGAFSPGKVTAGGAVKSIGTPEPLTIQAKFFDTKEPTFYDGPRFDTDDDDASVEKITFALNASAGSKLWYSIMRVSDAGAFPVTITTKKAVGTIATNTTLSNGSTTQRDDFTAVVKAQTESAAAGDPGPGTLSYYELTDTDGKIRDNIVDADFSKEVVKHGSIEYTKNQEGRQISPMHEEGTWKLTPDTEYYAYIVLTPASGTIDPKKPPQVYVYYFKTDAAPKPKISYVDKPKGVIDITVTFDNNNTDEAYLNWALYDQTTALTYLKGQTISIPQGVSGAPSMSWLDALETSWTNGTVVDGKQVVGYNYFDAFASPAQKDDMVKMILNSEPIDSINSNVKKGEKKPVETTSRSREANWAAGAQGIDYRAVNGLMLVAAHNKRSEPGESNWWEVDSFSIHRNVTYKSTAAPRLTPTNSKDVSGNGLRAGSLHAYVNAQTKRVTVSGSITLTFDELVHWRKEGEDSTTYRVVRSYDDHTGTGDNAIVGILYGVESNLRPFIKIDEDKGGPFTSFTIKIVNLPLEGNQSTGFDLLGGIGHIAKDGGDNGGYLSLKITNEWHPETWVTNSDGTRSKIKEAYYQPVVEVVHHANKLDTRGDQNGKVSGDETPVDSTITEPLLPPELRNVSGNLTATYDQSTKKFSISSTGLNLSFNDTLYWKQTGDNVYYEVSSGNGSPDATNKTVGILHQASSTTPSGTDGIVDGKTCTLKFSNVQLGSADAAYDFTLLTVGSIYVLNGSAGAEDGIRITLSIRETDRTANKITYVPVATVRYNGNDFAPPLMGTPFAVDIPGAPTLNVTAGNISCTDSGLKPGYQIQINLPFSAAVYKRDTNGNFSEIKNIVTELDFSSTSGTATISADTKSVASPNHMVTISGIKSGEKNVFVLGKNQLYGLGTQAIASDIKITVEEAPESSGKLSSIQKVTVTVESGDLANPVTRKFPS